MPKEETKPEAGTSVDLAKVKTLEALKKKILKAGKQGIRLSQQEVVEALDRFEMTDDDVEYFYEWLDSTGITYEDDDTPDETDTDTAFLETGDVQITPEETEPGEDIKILDGAKAYMHRIGSIPLLSRNEEIRTAEQAADGEGEGKR